MNLRIDNSDFVVPLYDEIPKDATFPCSTARMRYDKEDHRYYLTETALANYGIECEPKEIIRLIRTATDHIYSYIAVRISLKISFGSQTAYNIMCYRIAKSLFGRFKTEREGRKAFERMLVRQAEFINDFGDAKKTPKMIINPETGRIKDNDVDLSTGFWLDDEVLIFLKVNYLTDPNVIYRPGEVKWNEY